MLSGRAPLPQRRGNRLKIGQSPGSNPGRGTTDLLELTMSGNLTQTLGDSMKVTTVVGLVVLTLAAVTALTLLNGWVWMILFGIIWGEFQVGAPIGLLAAWGLATLGTAVLSGLGTAWHRDVSLSDIWNNS